MMRFFFHINLLTALILAAVGTPARADQRVSDVIAENVLDFGHRVGLQLAALTSNENENIIFSPLSIMTALSLLSLGAKSKSYQELKHVLGLDADSELIQNPNKFHQEFGLMLKDLQHKNFNVDVNNNRPNANWRFTNLRRTPAKQYRFRPPVEHITKVANGLFVQNGYSLNLDYSQVLKSVYETEFTQLDFQERNDVACDYINNWVKKATFGRIPKIIDDVDRRTKVILASALYFKSFWETQFFDGATTEDNFFPDGEHNPPIKVQMMAAAGIFPYYDAREYDCQIIGLPYRDNETTMYVIQPHDSTRQKLKDLQRALDARKINNIISNMERKTTSMVFPKMHFTSSMKLKKVLQNMNVHDIFVDGYSDLSLIAGTSNADVRRPSVNPAADIRFPSIFRQKPAHQSLQLPSNYLQDVASLALSNLEALRQKPDGYKPDLYVDDVIHNVDFSVDEQGTEAAAVTYTILLKTGSEVIFRGDKPFLIVIRHDPTKLPLFYGAINKPEL